MVANRYIRNQAFLLARKTYPLAPPTEFDCIAQVKLSDLLLANRHASLSLSLVGWRMFGSYVRSIMARAEESEVKIRAAL